MGSRQNGFEGHICGTNLINTRSWMCGELPTIQPWILPDATVDFTILEKKQGVCVQLTFLTRIGYIGNNYHGRPMNQIIKLIESEYHLLSLTFLLPLLWIKDIRARTKNSSLLTSLQCSNSNSRPDILIEMRETLYIIKIDGAYGGIFVDTSTKWV